MLERLRRLLPALIGLLLLAVAAYVLRREIDALSWTALAQDLIATPPAQIGWALLLTAGSYAVLTSYDLLAFETIGKRLPVRNVALASFLSYAIAHSIGFSILSGASVRYRFYTRWGVTATQLSQLIVSYSISFWLGLCLLGGLSLMLVPPHAVATPPGWVVSLLARILVVLPIAFVACAAWRRRRPLRWGRLEIALPGVRIALLQVLASVTDWAMTAGVLYALLPSSPLSFWGLLAPFMVAVLLGTASHVPGGLGVFEGTLVLLLAPWVPSSELLPRLVVYRLCYYLLPFVVALLLLTADELRQRRAQAARMRSRLGQISEQLVPQLFGAVAFMAGLVLLFSGATPAAHGRLDLVHRWLPLEVIEISHFTGSVVGAVLLILSQGLRRRLDSAYYCTVIAGGTGMVVSLFKGLDYEEAMVLGGVLVLLVRARPAFDRRAAFFETRFSPMWVSAVLAAIGGSIWLGLFAFKHVGYTDQLWWQFELHGQASRALRASVGSAMVAVIFAAVRVVSRAPHAMCPPDDAQLAAASAILAAQDDTAPNLVFLRDKALIFNDAGTAFLMYAVQGRSWVVMGDPVGPDHAIPGLIRAFLERCDDFNGIPVFYEVGRRHLHHYADAGLMCVKIGEEARVDLERFTLEGPTGAKFRQLLRRLEKDGGAFRVVPPAEVPALLPDLRAVSDDWLEARAGSEKGFSLGFFDDAYVSRFPAAVITVATRVVAFATVWPGATLAELSVDLMRFSRAAPRDAMEALFTHLMVWGKANGYRWFALGMAPLAGVTASPGGSWWNPLGAFVFRHGSRVYNFQGLRAYKEKFAPVWSPRYLVCPGGMMLPRLLADVTALIAGGYRRLFGS